MKSRNERGLKGRSVNFHLNKECNAKCGYCFAAFPGVKKGDRLTPAEQGELIDRLVDAGVGKINFAGGEPTLELHLGGLCQRIKERSRGKCAVSIVSNGYRLRSLIEESAESIDWVALSLDSGDDGVNADIGRTNLGIPYVEKMLGLGEMLWSRGVGVKCNTVVNRHNIHEDMSAVIGQLAPRRWKLFQMLPVVGENKGNAADYEVSREEFRAFVGRHRHLDDAGVRIVPEDNAHMTGSYLMIDPKGRFFWHVPQGGSRGVEYGDPILKVGLEKALKPVRFSERMYHARGAEYDWSRRV